MTAGVMARKGSKSMKYPGCPPSSKLVFMRVSAVLGGKGGNTKPTEVFVYYSAEWEVKNTFQ